MASLYETLKQVKSEEDVKDAYIRALGLKKYTKGLGSRDKVGVRNEICEVARCEPLANQGIRSATAEHILPFHATPQRIGRNVVNVLESMRNFVPRP